MNDDLQSNLQSWSESAKLLADALSRFEATQAKNQNSSAVIKVDNGGIGYGAAVTACVFTMLSLMLFAIWAIPSIRDLNAYQDMYGKKINTIELAIKNLQEKKNQ